MAAQIFRLRFVLFVAAFAALFATTGCEVEDDGDVATTTTTTTNNNPTTAAVSMTAAGMFSPEAVTIAPGGTVTWTNNFDAEVILDFSEADTGLPNVTLGIGQSTSVTFPTPGRYDYNDLNNGASGSVDVE